MQDTSVPKNPENPDFIVLSFSRTILRSLGFTREQVDALTDDDLFLIARSLEGRFIQSFLEALKSEVSITLVHDHWPKQG